MGKKLRVGDVLVGKNGEHTDLFVILKSEDDDECLDVVCLTREIGWHRRDGRGANVFDKGETAKGISECSKFDGDYEQYTFKVVKNLIGKSVLKAIVRGIE